MRTRKRATAAKKSTGAQHSGDQSKTFVVSLAVPSRSEQIAGALGNRAVGRLLQSDIAVGAPDSPFEREADRAADTVMRMPLAQGSENGLSDAQPSPRSKMASSAFGGGRPLGRAERDFFEPRFGADFSNVRVHAGADAAEASRGLNASAFTIGRDIAFGRGRYAPHTTAGRRLMAHELAHVVQQSRGLGKSASHSPAASLSSLPSEQVQRTFIATGETADFVSMVNRILEVQFRIAVSRTGEVSIHSTSIQGPPTRDAQELLRVIRMVVNDSKTTSIEFIRGNSSTRASDRNVIVGNYRLSRVDLDDVEAFGFVSSHSRMGDNAAVQLVHEITEQFRKQVHGEGFRTAHRAGYAAQERVLGATLVNETPMTPIRGTTMGEVTTTYRYPDGREVDVITRMDFSNGQIVSVRRVVR